jgi:beta-N-acetylhexosaminidase
MGNDSENMGRFLLRIIFYSTILLTGTGGFGAADARWDDPQLISEIGQLFVCGFPGTNLQNADTLKELVSSYRVGGLIFRSGINITDVRQFSNFIQDIKKYNQGLETPAGQSHPLFLCADEEGGIVHFLKTRYGYQVSNRSASNVGASDSYSGSSRYYRALAAEFTGAGLNFNFAPSVDLTVNPENPVIVKLERSFSAEPRVVIRQARIFIRRFRRAGALSCIKHFPGHGSSKRDSHRHFTDITETHQDNELDVFYRLRRRAPAIMVGHLFHRGYDSEFPATLSKKFVSILRHDWRYRGLIVTDDIEMKALTDSYSVREIVRLAVLAGNDLIICGGPVMSRKAIRTLYELVQSGEIPRERVAHSYRRITKYKKRYLQF